MIKNYILIALRHLRRQPSYAFLNIIGLTVGIASSILIVLYVSNELSFDEFHERKDRIYRISSDIREPDNAFRWAVTQLPLGRTLADEFDEVENYVRFIGAGRSNFELGERNFLTEDIFLVDSTVFDVFTFNMVAGDMETALDEPNNMVISQSLATRIFGKENPVGQLLKSDGDSYKVTGVYVDYPNNAHIIPNGLISSSSQPNLNTSQGWGGFNIFTYVLLQDGTDPKQFEKKLEEIVDKYVAVIFDQFNIEIKYEVIGITDIHLRSTFLGEPQPLGDIKYIYIFSAVALFLMLIACINYMNLSTARSMKRSLEVGIRKVMGAYRSTLVKQFLAESIVITFIALLLSLIIALVAVPIFNNQLGTNLLVSDLFSGQFLLILIGILLVTGVLSGSYPSLYLSRFKPAVVLKGRNTGKSGNSILRKVLVGIQFTITLFMLTGTVIIYSQMQYLESKDLGFTKEQMLKVSLNQPGQREKVPVLKNSLLQNPNIEAVTTANSVPGEGFGKNVMQVETKEGVMEDYGVDLFAVDYDYFPSLSIEILKGRNFSEEYVTDTASAVIVNEAMVDRLGWSEPIGKKFSFPGDSTRTFRVVGVAKDYHHQSLYNPISAILFMPRFNNRTILVKLEGDVTNGIKAVETAWNEVYPGAPFEYSFLDQDFLEQYETDQLRGKLFLGFALMMIFIACLGLLGLASFIAEQRTKEISIRKVLGANTNGLVTLLVKDFVLLVIFGAVPAFAGGYYFMNEWLQNFEYHISIGVGHFAIVLIVIVLITVLTTGYHALKAATSNPAENLKYE